MTTLREFEEVLREQGMDKALTLLERMKEMDRNKPSIDRLTKLARGRRMTPVLAEQVLSLHEDVGMRIYPDIFGETIRRGKGTMGSSRSPGTAASDEALDSGVRVPKKKPHPASETLILNDDDEASLYQFSELTETLEATADLLQQEISDDLRERRIALMQISETQNVIQKKIDEANEWLARRAG